MRYLPAILLVSVLQTPMQTNIGSGDVTIAYPGKEPSVQIGGGSIIQIKDADGKLMILIDRYGQVTLGTNYHPGADARVFWEMMAKYYPSVCQPPVKVRAKEVHK